MSKSIPKISMNEYFEFNRGYDQSETMLRFGQIFCNTYNVTDSELFYEPSRKNAEYYIIDNYVF